MDRREYTAQVLSCLRRVTWDEREAIRAELDGHMEDRFESLRELGYDETEAEERTLAAMGDPAEVGRALDRQYTGWGFVLLSRAAVLLTVVLCVQTLLGRGVLGNFDDRVRARSLRVALLYGLAAGGVLFTAAYPLGLLLYDSQRVGQLLRQFSLLVPMLYVDAVTDATVKGMGQQVACVRYNTLTSFLDVMILWVLLPRYGLTGYYISFVFTHALNFALSIRRLSRVTGFRGETGQSLRALAAWAAGLCICSLLPQGEGLGEILFLSCCFLGIFFLLLTLAGVLNKGDLLWVQGLVRPSEAGSKKQA